MVWKLKSRILGKTKRKVSSIGMGCWAIGGPFYHKAGHVIGYGHVKDDESIASIKRGLELGVTLFDTANVYGCGHSEKILGEAIKESREDVFIATKFGTIFDKQSGDSKIPCRIVGRGSSQEFVKKSCEESLEKLQTNYIDFYQVHSGNLTSEETEGIINALEDLVDQDKILHYGWSTDYIERAKLLAEGDHFAGTQFRLNLIHSNNEMVSFLDKNDYFGLVKNPIAGGILSGKYKADTKRTKDHMLHARNFAEGKLASVREKLEEAREILTADGRTIVQSALGYILAKNERLIPIPGFKNVKQVEENIKAMELGSLSNKKVREIDELFNDLRTDQSEIE